MTFVLVTVVDAPVPPQVTACHLVSTPAEYLKIAKGVMNYALTAGAVATAVDASAA